MDMLPKIERRIFQRAEIKWPVTIQTSQGLIEGKSRNLGAGGAYIYCDQTPKSGELIGLTIKPPDRPSLQITAEVLWKDKVVPLGMGVRFVEISENDCQFLYNVVSNHLRSGYEKYAKE
jgi:hypothetical protein